MRVSVRSISLMESVRRGARLMYVPVFRQNLIGNETEKSHFAGCNKKIPVFSWDWYFLFVQVWEVEGNPSYRSNLKKLNIRFDFVKLATKMNKFSAKKGRKRHIFLFIVPKMICCLRKLIEK